MSSILKIFSFMWILAFFDCAKCEEDQGFRAVALRTHNRYRSQYRLSPLELDNELNKLAHAHAEELADSNTFSPSEKGFPENLWSHRGELLPLAKDCEYAVKSWYTGSKAPGRTQTILNSPDVLKSEDVSKVGFGVGTSEKTGEGYTVVVAFYE